MPTIIPAPSSTDNVLSGSLVRNVDNTIHYVDPDAAPFLFITAQTRSVPTDNPKIEWIEKDLPPRWDQVNNGAGYSATATAVVVDNGAYFFPNDVVNVVRTGEKMLVVSVSSNTLTVIRAVDGDGTTGSAIVDNDDLQIIGSANAQGADVGTPRSHQETMPYNYPQIFRLPFSNTRTMEGTKVYGNAQSRTTKRAEAMIAHKIDRERAALFGERNKFTTGPGSANKPVYLTGGALFYLTSNNKNAGGILTEPELEDFMQSVFQATGGSSERLFLASATICSVLDMLAAGRIQTIPSTETGGLAIKAWQSNHGRLLVVKDRLLENGAGGAGYAGYGIALDRSKITHRPYSNGRTVLKPDVGLPGVDGWTDELLTEEGWQFENPSTMGVLTGVTG